MKLSILICSLEEREVYLNILKEALVLSARSIGWKLNIDYEILVETDSGEMRIGRKRNLLLKRAKGDYVAFIDDDDLPTQEYFSVLAEGIERGVDCVSLRGVMTTDGRNREIFEHSIRYKAWRTNESAKRGEVKYERFINHLNCIKREIATQIVFPELDHGEDRRFSDKLYESQLIKTEFYSDKIIYQYLYRSNK